MLCIIKHAAHQTTVNRLACSWPLWFCGFGFFQVDQEPCSTSAILFVDLCWLRGGRHDASRDYATVLWCLSGHCHGSLPVAPVQHKCYGSVNYRLQSTRFPLPPQTPVAEIAADPNRNNCFTLQINAQMYLKCKQNVNGIPVIMFTWLSWLAYFPHAWFEWQVSPCSIWHLKWRKWHNLLSWATLLINCQTPGLL